jgi:hypothetical protein
LILQSVWRRGTPEAKTEKAARCAKKLKNFDVCVSVI